MKYLFTTKPRGNLPPAVAPAVLKATKAWVNARIADRSLDFFYAFPVGGGAGVVNVDSHEALMKMVRDSPAFPFTETELHPLVDFNQSMDSALELFQKMVG
jgi:hypothetical protein